MDALKHLGWLAVIAGATLVLVGTLFLFADKIPWLGRLPGDLVLRKGNFTLWLPIGTALVLSVIATVLLNLFLRR